MLERKILFLIATVTLLIAPVTLSAQTEIEDATRDLDVGAKLRFETRSAGVGSGTFLRVEPPSLLWADSNGQTAQIQAEDLLRLEVERPAWRRGAAVGGVVGGLGGVLLGWLYSVGCGELPGECSGSVGKHIVVGAIKGGLAAGAVGAAIGSRSDEWHTLYPTSR